MLILLMTVVYAVPVTYIPPTKFPPSPRLYVISAYHELSDSIYAFSGALSVQSYNDLWQFSFATNIWYEMIPIDGIKPGIV